MAKEQPTKTEPKEESALTKANQELRTAEENYSRIAKKSMAGMKREQRRQHSKDCKKALQQKRLARAQVEALTRGKQPPRADQLKETQMLSAAEAIDKEADDKKE